MKAETKSWFVVLAVVALFAVILSMPFIIVFMTVPADPYDYFLDLLHQNLVLFFFAGFFILLLLAGGIRWFYANYKIPLQRLSDELHVINNLHPDYKIKLYAGKDLEKLVQNINRLVNDFKHIHRSISHEIREAKSELEYEKNLLATLLNENDTAIIVCNPAGDIMMYNNLARTLFANENGKKYLFGLGRSFWELIDDPFSDNMQRMLKSAQPVKKTFDIFVSKKMFSAKIVSLDKQNHYGEGFILFIDLPPGRPDVIAASAKESFTHFIAPGIMKSASVRTISPGTLLGDLACTVFDTEATGLNPSGGDELISIGAVRVLHSQVVRDETFDQLINPQRKVGSDAKKLHGIGDEMLAGQPLIKQVLQDFDLFCRNSVLVAHNAAFDMKFLKLKEASCGVSFDHFVLDTMLLAEVLQPQKSLNNLDDLAERFGIKINGRHTALGDALATAELFVKLISLLEKKGIHSLGDVQAACDRTQLSNLSY